LSEIASIISIWSACLKQENKVKTRNKVVLALLVGAIMVLIGWAMRPQPVSVETAEVTRGVFEQTVSDDGKTRVRDRYVVSAPLAGRLDRIVLKAGDPVEEGQVIAVLTPVAPAFLDARTVRELEERVGASAAQVQRTLAEAARAEAQLNQARADRDRAARLAKQGFVSETAREQAELTVRTAEKGLEAAQFAADAARHEAAQARAALTRYRSDSATPGKGGSRWEVRAPVRGSVLKVIHESEGAVTLGSPLVELADPRSLEAIVDVLTQESVLIAPGMPARVELGMGVPPLSAAVRRIEPAAFTKISALGVEEQRVNVVLDFTGALDRVQTVGDAFRVEAHIIVFRSEDAVKAPVGALFRDASEWAVFVVEQGRTAKRAIKVLRRNSVEAMIEGLKPGERIVVYPSDALTAGARVAVRNAPR
jgi:HlyD family secretion protein